MLVAAMLTGCGIVPKFDDVIPDKRTEYKKSKSLPDLEVPPDLTSGAISDSMNIPNEDQATLSEYQRHRDAPGQTTAPTEAVEPSAAGEQWVSVRASRYDVWPKLRTYFQDRGYNLELDDTELGVLETDWSKPVTEDGSVYRHKFKVFSEQGADPAVTVVFVSDARQKQALSADGAIAWVDAPKSEIAEKQLAGELNVLLNGSRAESVATAPAQSEQDSSASVLAPAAAADRKTAELVDAGGGKMYLAIPEEFMLAWRETELALQRGGFMVEQVDQSNGIYHITFFNRPAGEEEKKGWMSKLKFWKDDEPEGRPYQINLTGVGDKTEVVVLNASGEWETNEDSARILAVLQHQYNTKE